MYYGDVDGFACNQLAVTKAGEILAFGRSRVHIYNTGTNAFSATVYDWEAAGGPPVNPEEEPDDDRELRLTSEGIAAPDEAKSVQLAGAVDDLLM